MRRVGTQGVDRSERVGRGCHRWDTRTTRTRPAPCCVPTARAAQCERAPPPGQPAAHRCGGTTGATMKVTRSRLHFPGKFVALGAVADLDETVDPWCVWCYRSCGDGMVPGYLHVPTCRWKTRRRWGRRVREPPSRPRETASLGACLLVRRSAYRPGAVATRSIRTGYAPNGAGSIAMLEAVGAAALAGKVRGDGRPVQGSRRARRLPVRGRRRCEAAGRKTAGATSTSRSCTKVSPCPSSRRSSSAADVRSRSASVSSSSRPARRPGTP